MPHVHEKIDFTITVMIVFNNKVLLRKHEKYGIWAGPGGHIELFEDPNEAAIRETKEEVGLDIELYDSRLPVINSGNGKELIPPMFMNRHPIRDYHEHVDMVYFARAFNETIAPGIGESTQNIKWFTKEEVVNFSEIKGVFKSYALKALEVLGAKD